MFQLLKVLFCLEPAPCCCVLKRVLRGPCGATAGKKYLDFHQKMYNGRGQADKGARLAVAKKSASTRTAWKKIWPARKSRQRWRKASCLRKRWHQRDADLCHRRRRAHRRRRLDAIKAKINFARCGKAAC